MYRCGDRRGYISAAMKLGIESVALATNHANRRQPDFRGILRRAKKYSIAHHGFENHGESKICLIISPCPIPYADMHISFRSERVS